MQNREISELFTGVTFSLGVIATGLVRGIRDAGVLTEDQAIELVRTLSGQLRAIADREGAPEGAVAVYESVAETLEASIGEFNESSASGA